MENMLKTYVASRKFTTAYLNPTKRETFVPKTVFWDRKIVTCHPKY